jgi:hypothetical protein
MDGNRALLLSGPLAYHALIWPYHQLIKKHQSRDESLAVVALRSRSLDEANVVMTKIALERHTHALLAANTVPVIVFMARTLIGYVAQR